MNRLFGPLVLCAVATIALASSTANAQFTPLGSRVSIVSDVTIHRIVGGQNIPCLDPPFNPSPNVVLIRPEHGFVAYAERSVRCEDATLYVEQSFEVIELDEQPSHVSPGKVRVRTTSYLTYANNPGIKIGRTSRSGT